jgi:uncharacterized protein YjiS (DUF1127 family)
MFGRWRFGLLRIAISHPSGSRLSLFPCRNLPAKLALPFRFGRGARALRRSHRYGVVAAALGVISLAVALFAYATQPERIRVGVLRGEGPEARILQALQARLERGGSDIRLTLQPFSSMVEMKRAFDAGGIDAAPFSTMDEAPEAGDAAAILGRVRLLIVALADARAAPRPPREAGSRDQSPARPRAGLRVGLVAEGAQAERAGRHMLARLQTAADRFEIEAAAAAEAFRDLRAGRLDRLAFAAADAALLAREALAGVDAGEDLAVLSLPDVDQIARRHQSLEPVVFAAGSIAAKPPLPDAESAGISVPTRLLVRREFSENAAGELTRALLGERRQIARSVREAAQIEGPSSDRAAALTTHAGSIAYLEGETQTFFDRYGDFVYLALFGFSGLGSAFAALATWRESRRRRLDLARLTELRRLIHELGEARSSAEVEGFSRRYEEVMDAVMASANRLRLDQADLTAFMLAANLFNAKRTELRSLP